MGYLGNENAARNGEINITLTQMQSALYAAQESGLIIKNAVEIDETGLIGEGTSESPYVAARGYGNGEVTITSWPGARFVTDGFYNALQRSEVESGARSQQWLDMNYPRQGFARDVHQGADLVGSGDIVASVNGGLRLQYTNDGYGLQSLIASTANPTTGFFSAHMGSGNVMNYLQLFGSSGTSLQNIDGSFIMNGIQAGMNIGQQGSTGTSTGNHIHSEIRVGLDGNPWGEPEIEQWNQMFNENESYNYANSFNVTYYALPFTGYEGTNYTDPRLWNSLHEDWINNGIGSTNFPLFQFEHLLEAPAGFGLE